MESFETLIERFEAEKQLLVLEAEVNQSIYYGEIMENINNYETKIQSLELLIEDR